MTSKIPAAAQPNLDVALLDFAAEYAQQPDEALNRLQLLVLDPASCLARVAFLRALAKSSLNNYVTRRKSVEACREAIALVCHEGVFSGRLTPERVRQLDEWSRNPDALLEAHRRLTTGEEESPMAQSVDSGTHLGETGFTLLARSGRSAELENRLRPWVPLLLRRVGLSDDLDETLTRQFLAFVRSHLGEVRQRRFRECLPDWLRQFADQQGRGARLRADLLPTSAADVEADAVELTLRREEVNEPAWATAFRAAALGAGLRTSRELLDFESPASANALALPNYRRDLFAETRRILREGLVVYECDLR